MSSRGQACLSRTPRGLCGLRHSPAPARPAPSPGPLSWSVPSALLLGAAHGSVGREETDIKFFLGARTGPRQDPEDSLPAGSGIGKAAVHGLAAAGKVNPTRIPGRSVVHFEGLFWGISQSIRMSGPAGCWQRAPFQSLDDSYDHTQTARVAGQPPRPQDASLGAPAPSARPGSLLYCLCFHLPSFPHPAPYSEDGSKHPLGFWGFPTAVLCVNSP